MANAFRRPGKSCCGNPGKRSLDSKASGINVPSFPKSHLKQDIDPKHWSFQNSWYRTFVRILQSRPNPFASKLLGLFNAVET